MLFSNSTKKWNWSYWQYNRIWNIFACHVLYAKHNKHIECLCLSLMPIKCMYFDPRLSISIASFMFEMQNKLNQRNHFIMRCSIDRSETVFMKRRYSNRCKAAFPHLISWFTLYFLICTMNNSISFFDLLINKKGFELSK